MVGGSGGMAAVVGAMPNSTDTEAEVQSFVQSLLAHGRIDFGKPKQGFVASSNGKAHATHAIKKVSGKKVLRRIRFRCLCCS